MNKLEFTKYLAQKAGKLIFSNLNKTISVQSKGGVEIVTKTDKAVEKLLSNLIRNSKYNYPILSEETLKAGIESENLWVIDPLDGTTNFSKKNPRFSCSIALTHKGKPVVGVVYNPCTEELFYAEKGKGAYLNDQIIHVSKVKVLSKAVVCIDSLYNTLKERERGVKLYTSLAPPVTRGIRQTASAALDLCYVASGKFDAYICAYSQIAPWDFAAGALILGEAGGKLTNFQGKKWSLRLKDRLATNKYLHNELIKILKNVQ